MAEEVKGGSTEDVTEKLVELKEKLDRQMVPLDGRSIIVSEDFAESIRTYFDRGRTMESDKDRGGASQDIVGARLLGFQIAGISGDEDVRYVPNVSVEKVKGEVESDGVDEPRDQRASETEDSREGGSDRDGERGDEESGDGEAVPGPEREES